MGGAVCGWGAVCVLLGGFAWAGSGAAAHALCRDEAPPPHLTHTPPPPPTLLALSRLNSTNLPAFQSLLVKLRAALTRSRDRLMSWPGAVPAHAQCRGGRAGGGAVDWLVGWLIDVLAGGGASARRVLWWGGVGWFLRWFKRSRGAPPFPLPPFPLPPFPLPPCSTLPCSPCRSPPPRPPHAHLWPA